MTKVSNCTWPDPPSGPGQPRSSLLTSSPIQSELSKQLLCSRHLLGHHPLQAREGSSLLSAQQRPSSSLESLGQPPQVLTPHPSKLFCLNKLLEASVLYTLKCLPFAFFKEFAGTLGLARGWRLAEHCSTPNLRAVEPVSEHSSDLEPSSHPET